MCCLDELTTWYSVLFILFALISCYSGNARCIRTLQVSSARKTGVKSHDGVIIESASIIFNVSEFGTRMMQYVDHGMRETPESKTRVSGTQKRRIFR